MCSGAKIVGKVEIGNATNHYVTTGCASSLTSGCGDYSSAPALPKLQARAPPEEGLAPAARVGSS